VDTPGTIYTFPERSMEVAGTMSSAIIRVHARQIFDSRGKPTIEVEVATGDRTL
jgi:hypothetical protein